MATKLTTQVTVGSKAPHYWPQEQCDEAGNVIQPAVYAGLMVHADIRIGGDNRSGQHCVDLPEDATDEQIKVALLAQYGAA